MFELKLSNICQQLFRNNSEHCHSACQSFTLTTFLRSQETFTHQSVNEMTKGSKGSKGSDHSWLKT